MCRRARAYWAAQPRAAPVAVAQLIEPIVVTQYCG
jgi:hypothetical protein